MREGLRRHQPDVVRSRCGVLGWDGKPYDKATLRPAEPPVAGGVAASVPVDCVFDNLHSSLSPASGPLIPR